MSLYVVRHIFSRKFTAGKPHFYLQNLLSSATTFSTW